MHTRLSIAMTANNALLCRTWVFLCSIDMEDRDHGESGAMLASRCLSAGSAGVACTSSDAAMLRTVFQPAFRRADMQML